MIPGLYNVDGKDPAGFKSAYSKVAPVAGGAALESWTWNGARSVTCRIGEANDRRNMVLPIQEQTLMRALFLSGGLDSTCAWWVLGKPCAIYVGGVLGPAREAAQGELHALSSMCRLDTDLNRRLEYIQHDFQPFMRPGTWGHPRDQLCCQLAWAKGYDIVAFAWVKEDGGTTEGRDLCRGKYEGAVDAEGFAVQFPVAHMTKVELINAALAAGAPPSFILASHSCVRQSAEHCGTCENCKQRKSAIRNSNLGALVDEE